MMTRCATSPKSREHPRAGGQALVEFTLILFLVMGLCVGMLFAQRLLTFQFWAQQEARYLAFEQVWYAALSSPDPEHEPISRLANGNIIRRPDLVSRLTSNKRIRSDVAVNELLAMRGRTSHSGPVGGGSGVMLASAPRSIWQRRTGEWLEKLPLSESAYASVRTAVKAESGGELWPSDGEDEEPAPQSGRSRPELERAFIKAVGDFQFGEAVCPVFARMMTEEGVSPSLFGFGESSCPDEINRRFGSHLGREVRFREFFRDYEHRLQAGVPRGEAIGETVRAEVAAQFYSFFDQLVRTQQTNAPARLLIDGELAGAGGIASITRLLSTMAYVGSQIALGKISLAVGQLGALSSQNRAVHVEQDLERTINQVLHADAEQGELLGNNEFSLNPIHLPIPPEFGSALGKLQSGAMKNVLHSEGGRSYTELVEQSSRLTQVTYLANRGIFPAAARRYDTSHVRLTGKFYLITQPWHITRRIDGTGEYRSVGSQFDELGDDTEEGQLRQRVNGLWLLPREPGAMVTALDPFGVLAPVGAVLDSAGSVIGGLLDVAAGGIMETAADLLDFLPRFGGVILKIPRLPAVRPDSYPGSPEQHDSAAGTNRVYGNYLNEQRSFQDRAANPSFN